MLEKFKSKRGVLLIHLNELTWKPWYTLRPNEGLRGLCNLGPGSEADSEVNPGSAPLPWMALVARDSHRQASKSQKHSHQN